MEAKRENALPSGYDPDACAFGMSLVGDVEHCLQQADNEFWRRTLVRAVFAYVEAHTTILRRLVLEAYARHDQPRVPLTKIGLLQDYEYQPDEVGKVKRQALRLVTVKQIALTLRTLAEVMGKDDAFIRDRLFGVNEWKCLKEAMKVRDRLTHPKRHADLTVTAEEREACVMAFHWFATVTGELLDETRFADVIRFAYEEDEHGFWLNLKPE